jgi:5'-3' exonuclease
MGTTGFWSFYDILIKKIPLDNIKGKVAIIDIILYIHKYVIGIRKSGHDITTKDGKVINHIYAISKIIKNFTDNNILPVCVFDGKSPLLKEESVEKRKEIIEISKEKCEQLKTNSNENTEEYIKYFKRSFNITNDMIIECKQFLELSGIPFVNSIGEADPQCAGLGYYYKNISSGVFSEDSDILMYGAPCLLRDFDLKTNTVSIIYMEDILKYLQEKTDTITTKFNKKKLIFTKENFIDFSIIMGNDYCGGIRSNGGNNRDKLFELFVISQLNVPVFINIIYELNTDKIIYYVPENFLIKWKLSKKIYSNVEIILPSLIDINMKKPQIKNMNNFLEELNFREDIINHINESLTNVYNYFSNSIIITKPLSSCSIEHRINSINNNINIDDNLSEWITVGSRKKDRFN